MDTSVLELLRELDAQPPFATLDVLAAHLRRVDAELVWLWLVDYEQAALRRWTPLGKPDEETPIESTVGSAFRRQQAVQDEVDGTARMLAPITLRAERLGVLEVRFTAPPDQGAAQIVQASAAVVAYVLLAARRYTDVFERVRRSQDLEVPAEIQWELLPVLAHDGPDFNLAGALEPAYDIGGDNFDYTVEQDAITVSITDAMGHGTRAAMLCSLAVAVSRNARRRGESLRQQARAVNAAVHDHFGGEAFLTQLAFRIERRAGHAKVVNAGHSYGYLLRAGRVSAVDLEADLPLGLFADAEFTVQTTQLQRGDRLLLLTDGVLEAAPEGGGEFGRDRVADLLEATVADHPTEVVRKLTRAVIEHRASHLLDDATAVCVDYRRR